MRHFPTPLYPWQQQIWQRLCDQHADQRLPHALLFVGQAGWGIDHLAAALQQRLLCLSPVASASGQACGQCKSCLLMKADSHPDQSLLQPEEGSQVIKIDQIRQLLPMLNQRPQQGRCRVVRLLWAEQLHHNAANAILKALEEPPSDVFFMLMSEQPSRLLPTIRSRCQLVKLEPPSAAAAASWLREHAKSEFSEAEQHEALLIAEGAPILAQALLHDGSLKQESIQLKALLRWLRSEDTSTTVLAAIKPEKNALSGLLDRWLRWLSMSVKLRFGGEVTPLHEQRDLFALLDAVPPMILFRFHDKLLKLKSSLLSSPNLNETLLLEELLLDWKALPIGAALQQNARQSLTHELN